MKTNKLIAAATLVALTATGLSYSYADEESTTNTVNQYREMKFDRVELTDEQKAEMQAQREEKQAEREAREAVIDALLAGETLTADQEVIRAEIIEQRAQRKAEMQEKQAQREQMQAIMQKSQAGEELTDEEQALLDEMKSHRGGKQKGERGGHKQGFQGKMNSQES